MTDIQAKIYLQYGDPLIFGKREIKNIEIHNQFKTTPSAIEYSVIPSSGHIEIIDIDGKIRDAIENQQMSPFKTPIDIFINGKSYSKNIIETSDYNINSQILTLQLTDKLYYWKDIKVATKQVFSKMSAYELLQQLLTYVPNVSIDVLCSNKKIIGINDYSITEYLKSITLLKPCYNGGTLIETMNKFCAMTQLSLALNKNGEPEFFDSSASILQQELLNIPASTQYSHLEKNIIKTNAYNNVELSYPDLTSSTYSNAFQSLKINIWDKNGESLPPNYVFDKSKYPEYNVDVRLEGATDFLYIELSFPLSDGPFDFGYDYLYNPNMNINAISDILNYEQIVHEDKSSSYTFLNSETKTEPLRLSIEDYNTEISRPNEYKYKIEDNKIFIKTLLYADIDGVHYEHAPNTYNIWYAHEINFDISLVKLNTTNSVLKYIGDGNNRIEISGNELINEFTKYNDESITDFISNNILSNYANGVSDGNITTSVTNYYNTNGDKQIDIYNGQTIGLGSRLQIDGDNDLWTVTGKTLRKQGCPFMDLELMQLNLLERILTIKNIPEAQFITIERTSSSKSDAPIGQLNDGDILYSGDQIKVVIDGETPIGYKDTIKLDDRVTTTILGKHSEYGIKVNKGNPNYIISIERNNLKNFAEASENEISLVCEAGLAQQIYKIGDIKTITLTDGTPTQIRITGFKHDINAQTLYPRTIYTAMTIELVNCLKTPHAIQTSNINNIQIDTDKYLPLFPEEWRKIMRPVYKKRNAGTSTSTVQDTTTLFLPSIAEIFSEKGIRDSGLLSGSIADAVLSEGSQYEYYKNEIGDAIADNVGLAGRVTRKKLSDNGANTMYFTRSPQVGSETYYMIDQDGYAALIAPTFERGISLFFCVGVEP